MRFEDEVLIRILPYSQRDILRSVAQQLENDTIINVIPLKKFASSEGIAIKVRRLVPELDKSHKTFYKLTNDERRQLIKRLELEGYR